MLKRRSFLAGVGAALGLGLTAKITTAESPTPIKAPESVKLLDGMARAKPTTSYALTSGIGYVPIKNIEFFGSRNIDVDHDGLRDSILKYGMLRPLIVQPIGNDQYRLLDGARRLKVAQDRGWTVISVQITENNVTTKVRPDEVIYGGVEDNEHYQSLKKSIKEMGILNTCLIAPCPKTGRGYVVVSGNKRFKAAKELGLLSVPVMIKHMTQAQIDLQKSLESSPYLNWNDTQLAKSKGQQIKITQTFTYE